MDKNWVGAAGKKTEKHKVWKLSKNSDEKTEKNIALTYKVDPYQL